MIAYSLYFYCQIRYAALECIDRIAQKLGDEYLPLVPETIPFLGELMEGMLLEYVEWTIIFLTL